MSVLTPILKLLKRGSLFALSLLATLALFAILPLIQQGSSISRPQEDEASTQLEILFSKTVEPPKPEEVKELMPMRSTSLSSQTAGPTSSFDFSLSMDLSVANGGGIGVGGGGEGFSTIFEEGETDEPPVPIRRTAIPYPRAARNAGIEGVLEIVFVIDHEGEVADITFEQIPHEMFRRPVEDVVRQWRFTPARNQGVPVSVRARQTINFKLER